MNPVMANSMWGALITPEPHIDSGLLMQIESVLNTTSNTNLAQNLIELMTSESKKEGTHVHDLDRMKLVFIYVGIMLGNFYKHVYALVPRTNSTNWTGIKEILSCNNNGNDMHYDTVNKIYINKDADGNGDGHHKYGCRDNNNHNYYDVNIYVDIDKEDATAGTPELKIDNNVINLSDMVQHENIDPKYIDRWGRQIDNSCSNRYYDESFDGKNHHRKSSHPGYRVDQYTYARVIRRNPMYEMKLVDRGDSRDNRSMVNQG